MDKKSKELMRKHKKVRPASSSESSSSSDSDSGSSGSYSSSSSDKKAVHRKGKKVRPRRSSSSSDDERARKRDKHACHRKLEAKKNHLKRKLKESKAAKKRVVSPSMRRRSISPHKLKKIPVPGSSAEKKHHQMILKERMLKEKEREREKLRLNRERMAASGRPIGKEQKSRSPSKALRCRELKQRKSPVNLDQQSERHHHQISPREKIIIQTRRERSPSQRTKGSKDVRYFLDDRRERDRAEAARQKEREEALARCQERQRERERIAREKQLRRDKEFDRDRLLPRPAEREMALAAARAGNSRDRSIEPADVRRAGHSHGHSSRQVGRNEIDFERENYDRERAYVGRSLEREDRRGGSTSGDIDREYHVARHRDISSPAAQSGHYSDRQRDPDREIYPDEERYEHHDKYATQKRIHSRGGYVPPIEEPAGSHHRRGERGAGNWEHSSHREREPRSIDRDWKSNKEEWDSQHWDDPKWQQKTQQQHSRKKPAIPLGPSDENWDEDDAYSKIPPAKKLKTDWNDPTVAGIGGVPGVRIKHDHAREDHTVILAGPHDAPPHPVPHQPHIGRRWPQQEWRPRGPAGQIHVPGGPAPVAFRHNAPIHPHPMDYTHERPDYRRQPHHYPGHLPHHHPVGYHHIPRPQFPSKRQMTYTNPNILQNQKAARLAAAAAAAAAQLSNALTAASVTVSTTGAIVTTTTSSTIATTQPISTSKIQTTLNKPGTVANSPNSTISATTTSATATSPTPTILEQSTTGVASTITGTTVTKTENVLEQNSENSSETNDNDSKKLESGEIAKESSGDGITDSGAAGEETIPDDLSEISDEADEILNKDEELAKNSIKNKTEIDEKEKSTTQEAVTIKNETLTSENNSTAISTNSGDLCIKLIDSTDKDLNDDLLDFEEISDGELEEESRKNLGDALGVDWASLVQDTKIQTGQSSDEQHTTAKQKWQPHRVILDIGISFKFAGEEFAKKILNDAKQKLCEEQKAIKTKMENKVNVDDQIKSDIKIKIEEDAEEFSRLSTNTTNSNTSEIKTENIDCATENSDEKEDDENISGIACVQVARRRAKEIRKNLVFNACGPNSRALSAANDMNLRRQLCGLPVTQIDRPRKVNEKLKLLAIQAFQKASAIGEVQ